MDLRTCSVIDKLEINKIEVNILLKEVTSCSSPCSVYE